MLCFVCQGYAFEEIMLVDYAPFLTGSMPPQSDDAPFF